MSPNELDATDLLIVAAHAPDMAGLRPYLSDQLIGDVRGLHIRGKAVGIGIAAAGPATARGILAVSPRAVIQIGSCGVYPTCTQYKPHDVIVSSRISLVSHAVNAQKSEFPAPMTTQLECNTMLVAGLTSVKARTFSAPIACTLARTVDDKVATTMQPATECDAENLEAFSIASACKSSEIPFCAVLGVSNIVGSTGTQDWVQFQRAAVNAAAEVIVSWIQRGAQGLPHG